VSGKLWKHQYCQAVLAAHVVGFHYLLPGMQLLPSHRVSLPLDAINDTYLRRNQAQVCCITDHHFNHGNHCTSIDKQDSLDATPPKCMFPPI